MEVRSGTLLSNRSHRIIEGTSRITYVWPVGQGVQERLPNRARDRLDVLLGHAHNVIRVEIEDANATFVFLAIQELWLEIKIVLLEEADRVRSGTSISVFIILEY